MHKYIKNRDSSPDSKTLTPVYADVIQRYQVETDLFGLTELFHNYKNRTSNDYIMGEVNKTGAMSVNNNQLLGYDGNNKTVPEAVTLNETVPKVVNKNKNLNGAKNDVVNNFGGICRVCMDKTTGYHYGILSCEGCKVRVRFI